MMIKLIVFLFLLFDFELISSLDECNIFDKTRTHVFCTKTNYNESLIYFNDTSSVLNLDFVPDHCELDQVYLLSRHSTRNPSADRLVLFNKLIPKLKKSLHLEFDTIKERSACEYYLYYHLTKWQNRYRTNETALIVKIGEEITKEIGSRFFKAFSSVFEKAAVGLAVSNETRTLQTLKAFVKGIKVPLGKTKIQVKQSMHFHHLLLDDEDYEDDDDTEDELIRKYKKSKTIKSLKKKISKRLGLDKKLKLNEIKSLFQLCAFDLMLYNDSFWCNFFKDEELQTIEFLLDATMFRKLHVNAEPVLRKSAILFAELRAFLMNKTGERVFLGFSHSEVLKVVVSNLGLFEGGLYLEDDFDDAFRKSSEREWRSSRMMSFNANFIFAKYYCLNKVSNMKTPKILTLYQERPVRIGPCNDYLCNMDTFLRFIYPLHKNITDL